MPNCHGDDANGSGQRVRRNRRRKSSSTSSGTSMSKGRTKSLDTRPHATVFWKRGLRQRPLCRGRSGPGPAMKFGIFFEMSTPRPFTGGIEPQVFMNALEQARLADELGFDWVWAVEHHFLEEYSHCSAPEVVLAAVAAQTSRVRIGHGAVVCVPEMNHPIRVAERCATLDIISGGRLEVGTARSLDVDRARRLQRQPRRHQEDVGRVRAGVAEDVGRRTRLLRRQLLLDARAQRVTETGAEAAPADVGHGHEPRHRTRRRRTWSRLPRRRGCRLRGTGAADEGVLPPHRELRPRGGGRDQRGDDAQFPVLP